MKEQVPAIKKDWAMHIDHVMGLHRKNGFGASCLTKKLGGVIFNAGPILEGSGIIRQCGHHSRKICPHNGGQRE